MRGVNIETLSKWEGDRIIIEGRISWWIVDRNGRMSETSNEFLYVPNALDAANWWAKCRAIPAEAHEVKITCRPIVVTLHTKIQDRDWTSYLTVATLRAQTKVLTHSWNPPILLQWTIRRTWNIPKPQSAILVSCISVLWRGDWKNLVGTQLLHCVHIFDCQIQSFKLIL